MSNSGAMQAQKGDALMLLKGEVSLLDVRQQQD